MGYLQWFDYFYYYLIKESCLCWAVYSLRREGHAIKVKHDLSPEEFRGSQMGGIIAIIASLGIF